MNKINGITFKNIDRMSVKNSKLHNTFIFDLPAGPLEMGGTCLNSAECWPTCYARKAQRQYKNTATYRVINQSLAINNPKFLQTLLLSQIDRLQARIKTLRIHSSGDFFSQSYINLWATIARVRPNVKFYSYTKVKHLFNFNRFTKLSNTNLIDSYIYNKDRTKKYLNYGNYEHINQVILANPAVKICPATLPSENKIKCNKECFYCLTNDKVVFKIH